MEKTAAIITVSDKCSRGERIDTSGPALREILLQKGLQVVYMSIVPDEMELIKRELVSCVDEKKVSLILTTGGTGFSARDVTPEASKAVIEREAPGVAEAMRAASMAITPRGCLSRGVAGIRGRSLIVNLPGSRKAAVENILSVIDGLLHGLDMLQTDGSADCASDTAASSGLQGGAVPSLDRWLEEAKTDPDAPKCGMYLFHTGTVRATAKATVRPDEPDRPDAPDGFAEYNEAGELSHASCDGIPHDGLPHNCISSQPRVSAIDFSYDEDMVKAAVERCRRMPGIYYVRAWLNHGVIPVGGPLMLVLVGGDIRPNVMDALQSVVAEIKTACVSEKELFEP
jgi:molybdenum cofactor synthesis domain-containing protein